MLALAWSRRRVSRGSTSLAAARALRCTQQRRRRGLAAARIHAHATAPRTLVLAACSMGRGKQV